MTQSKDSFVQRTKRIEQLILFMRDKYEKGEWITHSSIQDFLKELGILNPSTKYIDKLLSRLEKRKRLKLYGCLRCDKSEGINCSDCPYDLYKKEMKKKEIEDGIVNDHRSISKVIAIPTELGLGYAADIGKEIEGCNHFIQERFGS